MGAAAERRTQLDQASQSALVPTQASQTQGSCASRGALPTACPTLSLVSRIDVVVISYKVRGRRSLVDG